MLLGQLERGERSPDEMVDIDDDFSGKKRVRLGDVVERLAARSPARFDADGTPLMQGPALQLYQEKQAGRDLAARADARGAGFLEEEEAARRGAMAPVPEMRNARGELIPQDRATEIRIEQLRSLLPEIDAADPERGKRIRDQLAAFDSQERSVRRGSPSNDRSQQLIALKAMQDKKLTREERLEAVRGN